MKKELDQGDVFGALLTDLSKAFDCIPHNLIISKLEAYGLEIGAQRLIHAYLINRKQRVKVNEAYSSWKDLIFGDLYLALCSLIYICAICFISWRTLILQVMQMTLQFILPKITKSQSLLLYFLNETSSAILFKWFNNNFMKANNNKSHLLMSCKEPSSAIIEGSCIKSSQKELLLGVTIDNELKFDDYINYLCKKAGQKLNALV